MYLRNTLRRHWEEYPSQESLEVRIVRRLACCLGESLRDMLPTKRIHFKLYWILKHPAIVQCKMEKYSPRDRGRTQLSLVPALTIQMRKL